MAHKKRITAEEFQQVSTAFAVFFPNCFVHPGTTKRPLKIGIKHDLLASARQKFPLMSGRQIRGFLDRYTSDRSYFMCVRHGSTRVDLQGNFTGFVSERDARFALSEIERLTAGRKRRVDGRKRAEEPDISVGQAVAEVMADRVQSARRLPWARALSTETNATPWPTPVAASVETIDEKLQRLLEAQYTSSMSDGMYYSNGRKAKDDAEIASIRQQIRKRDHA